MTKQIAVRLPEDTVEFLDHLVDKGVGSRATIITAALARERRRRVAEADAAILAGAGPDPDMDALAAFAAGQPSGLD